MNCNFYRVIHIHLCAFASNYILFATLLAHFICNWNRLSFRSNYIVELRNFCKQFLCTTLCKLYIAKKNECCNIKGLTDTYVITFEKVDAGYEGTKLLGYPSNDVDDSDDRCGLLLQYDPLDFDVPFLSTLDGYAFVFFGDDDEDKFSGVDYVVWGS